MTDEKHLILFFAGMGERKRDIYLDELVNGMINTLGDGELHVVLNHSSVGRRELTVQVPGRPKKIVQIHAVFWGDLVPSLSEFSLPLRAAHGLLLLQFWLNRRLFVLPADMQELRLLRRWIATGAVLLLLWYIASLLLLLQAYGTDVVNAISDHVGAFGPAIKLTIGAAALLAGWKLFSQGVDVAYAIKAYIQDARSVRERIRRRALSVLIRELRDTQGQQVTILAHSFGTVVAVEALAHLPKTVPCFDLITIGSPLQLVVYRDPKFLEIIRRCQEHTKLHCWRDFYASLDAFCTRVPADESQRFQRSEIDLGMSAVEGAMGQAHDRYFSDLRVIGAILRLPDEQAETALLCSPGNGGRK